MRLLVLLLMVLPLTGTAADSMNSSRSDPSASAQSKKNAKKDKRSATRKKVEEAQAEWVEKILEDDRKRRGE